MVEKTSRKSLVYKLSSPEEAVEPSLAGQPLFFDPDGRSKSLLPTLYTLWCFPNMVKHIIVPIPVSKNLCRGADVMLPGVQHGSAIMPLRIGDVRAIHVMGNEAAVAVGLATVDDQYISTNGMIGRVIEVYHSYMDALWSSGSKIVPNQGFGKGFVTSSDDSAVEAIEQQLAELQASDQQNTEIPNNWDDDLEEIDELESSGSDDGREDEIGDGYVQVHEIEEKVEAVALPEDLEEHDLSPPLNIETALSQAVSTIDDSHLPIDVDSVVGRMLPLLGEKFDIQSTQHRSWPLFFKSMQKRGLLKMRERKTIYQITTINRNHKELRAYAMVDSRSDDEEVELDDDIPESVDSMDEMMVDALVAAMKSSLQSASYPLPASSLFSEHMKPCAIDGANLDPKKSTWKKFAKFVKAMSKEGFFKIKEQKNGISIVTINMDHPRIRGAPPAIGATNGSARTPIVRSSKSLTASRIHVAKKYRASKSIAFLFTGHQPTELFKPSDVRDKMWAYCEAEGLLGPGGTVKLNPQLAKAFWKESAPTEAISKQELSQRVLLHVTEYYAILDEGADESEAEFKRGPVPLIEVLVEKRQGRKLITRIKSLEDYGISPSDLQQYASKKYAASSSVKTLPGKTHREELLVQGRVDAELIGHLTRDLGIPPRFVNVVLKL